MVIQSHIPWTRIRVLLKTRRRLRSKMIGNVTPFYRLEETCLRRSVLIICMDQNKTGTHCCLSVQKCRRCLLKRPYKAPTATGFQGLGTTEKDFQSHTCWLAKYSSSFISHLSWLDVDDRLEFETICHCWLKLEGGSTEGGIREGKC